MGNNQIFISLLFTLYNMTSSALERARKLREKQKQVKSRKRKLENEINEDDEENLEEQSNRKQIVKSILKRRKNDNTAIRKNKFQNEIVVSSDDSSEDSEEDEFDDIDDDENDDDNNNNKKKNIYKNRKDNGLNDDDDEDEGFGDAMEHILNSHIRNREVNRTKAVPILAEYTHSSKEIKKQKQEDFVKKLVVKKKREIRNEGYLKEALPGAKEAFLRKQATKGVVKLFNLIKTQQSMMKSEKGVEERNKVKDTEGLSKEKFLSILNKSDNQSLG